MRKIISAKTGVDLALLHESISKIGIHGFSGVSSDNDLIYVEFSSEYNLEKEQEEEIERIVASSCSAVNWDQVRRARYPLLLEADWRIQRSDDNGEDSSSLRDYRKKLRDITNQIDTSAVVWPDKPWLR